MSLNLIRSLSPIVVAAFYLLWASMTLADPLSPYFLTAGDQGTNWIVQGATVVNSWTQQHPEGGGEYAMAVASTIRTLGNQASYGPNGPNHPGAEYTLAGAYTVVNYPYPLPTSDYFDGTTDGQHNYSVGFTDGGVYQFTSNWTSGSLLFSTPGNYLGITYDATNNSLWISRWNANLVENRSLSGTLLSSFDPGFNEISCLALDPADNTLWMGSQGTYGTFYQFSKAGALLDTVSYAPLSNQNTLGGEFRFVPEPSTLALLGSGLLGLAFFIWRCRRA